MNAFSVDERWTRVLSGEKKLEPGHNVLGNVGVGIGNKW